MQIVLLFLVVLLLPYRNNLFMGQVNLLVLFCIILSVFFAERNACILSGCALSIAILIKISPVVLLLYYGLRKMFGVILYTGLTVIILSALSALVLGPEPYVWYFNFLPHMSFGKHIPGLFPPSSLANFSISGWLLRIVPGVSPAFLSTLCWSSIGVCTALYVLMSFPLQMHINSTMLLAPAMYLMILASSLLYLHHVVYIVPAVFLVLYYWSQKGHVGHIAFVVVFITLAGTDFPLLYRHIHFPVELMKFASSVNLYALLLLFIHSIYTVRIARLESLREI